MGLHTVFMLVFMSVFVDADRANKSRRHRALPVSAAHNDAVKKPFLSSVAVTSAPWASSNVVTVVTGQLFRVKLSGLSRELEGLTGSESFDITAVQYSA